MFLSKQGCLTRDILELFLVDGGWSTWMAWSLCSKNCGHQEEVRTRVCNNPVQRNGGEYCTGHDIEVMPCNEYDYVLCPGNFTILLAAQEEPVKLVIRHYGG